MTTLVNSIKIPYHFVELCEQWHGSIHCLMYAVSSTGNLTTGSIRSRGCETTEQWYLTIWRDLAVDVSRVAAYTNEQEDKDAELFRKFEQYVNGIMKQLESEYDLADWEPEP